MGDRGRISGAHVDRKIAMITNFDHLSTDVALGDAAASSVASLTVLGVVGDNRVVVNSEVSGKILMDSESGEKGS